MSLIPFLRPIMRLPNVATDAGLVLTFRSDRVKVAPVGSDTFKCAVGAFAVTMVLDLMSNGIPSIWAMFLAIAIIALAIVWARRSHTEARAVHLLLSGAAAFQCLEVALPSSSLPICLWMVAAFAMAAWRLYRPEPGR